MKIRFIDGLKNYASLVKFSHSLFALPFALIGFFLATMRDGSSLSLKLLALVVLCMVFARNAAMSFNRYADRHIDKMNPRTLVREIPAGIIHARSALLFSIANGLLFIIATWFINPLCFKLSPVALLVVMGYSLTKRFSALSHVFLGIGLALAPIGAFLAVTGRFELLPLLFSACVIFWVAGFDIIYALQDEEFDRSLRLHSLPVRLGKRNSLILSAVFHLLSIVFVVLAGLLGGFDKLYWTGAIIFSALVIYQHTLVKPNDLSRVNLAFFTTNGIASLVFAAFVISDIIFY